MLLENVHQRDTLNKLFFFIWLHFIIQMCNVEDRDRRPNNVATQCDDVVVGVTLERFIMQALTMIQEAKYIHALYEHK